MTSLHFQYYTMEIVFSFLLIIILDSNVKTAFITFTCNNVKCVTRKITQTLFFFNS